MVTRGMRPSDTEIYPWRLRTETFYIFDANIIALHKLIANQQANKLEFTDFNECNDYYLADNSGEEAWATDSEKQLLNSLREIEDQFDAAFNYNIEAEIDGIYSRNCSGERCQQIEAAIKTEEESKCLAVGNFNNPDYRH